MIDLIIPVYKNLNALQKTMESVNLDIFKVTVIDDGSNVVHHSLNYNLISLQSNVGPGQARQWGIWNTSNPYLMFIDAGDIFISKEIQEKIAQTIEQDPDTNIFFWLYYYKDQLVKHTDNRMHGKVYKRSFLNKYSITFNKEGSYMDEDIGFNRTCRIISNQEDIAPIRFIDEPVIQWIEDENSLTQKNNKAALYKDQTRGLALNSIHTLETCKKNNINAENEMYEIASALYYWFIRTAVERPEFIQYAWSGASIFYKYCYKDIDQQKLYLDNKTIEYRKNVPFPLNIKRFAIEIINNKSVPSHYKHLKG